MPKTYIAKNSIKFHGKYFKAGEALPNDLSEPTVAYLLATKAIKVIDGVVDEAKPEMTVKASDIVGPIAEVSEVPASATVVNGVDIVDEPEESDLNPEIPSELPDYIAKLSKKQKIKALLKMGLQPDETLKDEELGALLIDNGYKG